MQRAGLAVTTGIAQTGVIAVLHGDRPGRTIAWRADMDALPIREAANISFASLVPDVMHACGHDGHTAIAVTVAEALAARRSQLAGNVVFLFQPAEEVFGGAQPMLDSGALDAHRVEEIYGLHLTSRLPTGRVETCAGISMAAADVLEIEVHGRGGHGATPQLTVDPLAVAAQLLVGLQQVIDEGRRDHALLSIGQVIGGTAFNIIPDLIEMRGSLRTLRSADRNELLERLKRYVETVAAEQRARAVIRTIGCCPSVCNAEAQTTHVHACASIEVGADHVDRGDPVMASDDMALFLAARPGSYFRVGGAPAGGPVPHHSALFEIDDAALGVGARVAAAVLLGAMR